MRSVLLVTALFVTAVAYAQPANDNCSGAIALTVSPTGACANGIPGTTVASTQSQPGCLGSAEDDVWYKFTATSSEHVIRFAYDNPTFMEPVIELFSGTCGSLVSLKCTERKVAISTALDIFTGLTPGTEYFFRVYDKNAASLKYTFRICVYAAIANDECSGAFALPINSDTSWTLNTEGSFQYSTASAGNCRGGSAFTAGDVWFSFVATDTVHILRLIERGSSFTNGLSYQFYSGTCGSLVLKGMGLNANEFCGGTDGVGPSYFTYVQLRRLTAGDTYYIRVERDSAGYPSTAFNIAISNPPDNDICSNATEVPVNAGNNCVSKATGNLQNATANAFAGECSNGPTSSPADVWFKFTATSSRHLVSVNLPLPGRAIINAYSGSCGAFTSLTCGSSFGANQNVRVEELNGLVPGQVYHVRVRNINNYLSGGVVGDVPFEICVTTPGVPPTNEDCGTASPLSAVASQLTLGTMTGAAAGTPIAGVSCGTHTGDVWYSFTPPYNAQVGIRLRSNTSTSHARIAAFNGPCGSLTYISCSSDGDPQTIFFTALASNTYYLRISPFSSAGAFALSVSTLNPLPVTLNDFRIERTTDKSINLRWLTTEESKMKSYIIQRSADGLNFVDISSVPARNQSTNDYSFTDNAPLAGRNFYRLKIVDVDDKIEYSKIIDASLKGAGSYGVYSSNNTLMITNDKSSASRVSVNIYDEAGRQLVKKDLVLRPGVNALPGLMPSKGNVLLVHLTSEEGARVFKIYR
jgi:hypothetical protein